MDGAQMLTRRTFLTDLGRGAIALTVVGIAGCAPAASGSATPGVAAPPQPTGGASNATDAPAASPSRSGGPVEGGVAWERVNLGFVSAYVLIRGGEAAVVDTGVAGSEDEIGAALERIGLGWGAVGHVVLTHMHPDHAGGAAAVLDQAPDATGYAGAQDVAAITVPRPLVSLADGDRVFDLLIVATPGHTAGHVAVLDEIGGILVAGDALGTSGGVLQGSNPQFTADTAAAKASVAKLGALRYETLLVGHGEPILAGASSRVAALAGG